MGYTHATLNELAASGAEVCVVSWDLNRLSPIAFDKSNSVTFIEKSVFSLRELVKFAENFNPDLTVVSGWQDAWYLVAAFSLRRKSKIVVSGFDGQTSSSMRHQLGYLLGKLGVFRWFFSHAWVAGPRQFEFARKLGFSKRRIISDLYSCDTKIFCRTPNQVSLSNKQGRSFVFVGRLENEKGLTILLSAWLEIQTLRRDWKLVIIGSGSLYSNISREKSIVLKNAMAPAELAIELSSHDCFVLPSVFEPWGVVVHEAAASGLPLLLSDEVGAGSTFLIQGMNGFSFEAGSVDALKSRMLEVMGLSDSQLEAMGRCSIELARRINPATSAHNLLSLLR